MCLKTQPPVAPALRVRNSVTVVFQSFHAVQQVVKPWHGGPVKIYLPLPAFYLSFTSCMCFFFLCSGSFKVCRGIKSGLKCFAPYSGMGHLSVHLSIMQPPLAQTAHCPVWDAPRKPICQCNHFEKSSLLKTLGMPLMKLRYCTSHYISSQWVIVGFFRCPSENTSSRRAKSNPTDVMHNRCEVVKGPRDG